MVDYLQELRFGLFPSPDAAAAARTLELAQVAEVSGLDLLTVQDHPYQSRHLDALTLLSVVAARTTTLRVALNVANLPLRPPVVLARSTASLDLLTGGRVELGLGAGAFWDGVVAAGGERRTPGEAVDALEEGIEVVRAVWQEGGPAVRVEGRFHRVVGLHPGPAPAHPVEVWLGAYGPRMLRLTGRVADGWLPSMGYADPDRLGALTATLDDAARAAGRDPASVRRLYNVMGRLGGRGTGPRLHGTAADWAEQLAALTEEHGISTFVLASDDERTVRVFGEEVAPDVRERVTARRAGDAGAATRGRPVVELGPGAPPQPLAEGEGAWDESTRPRFPAPEGASYTAVQQAQPAHLVEVHDHLRSELEQLRGVIEQVEAGRTSVGQARSEISRMTLRQNAWTLGAYCEQYCRVLTTHHTIEDVSMFPRLRQVPGAAPVLDRLTAEHHVIHDLLERVDRALVGLVTGGDDGLPGDTAPLRAVVDLLSDALLSHLSYEERELYHPLAQVGFQ
ncbi:LLM class flavin-dependent oxidoreductase [Lapillicoccus jejuensis]|uniref:Alkanesulfonate monooxygenase SsuD/methylene tetrahydromethanopterin reductase-like flavin-dependent oxidoreductase (Luciferase family) n=1 Tax=Lapillicoccus jejuensis TaxID=402171 RepID=A0A542DZM7_9MICO|nr:LLM class flavin-dependent oxidoreductase [Lapillicoccus jejuensis]TQJ08540.1 alkanesulfonate monooxygenase SsuD/methylene tetrahydromethanopterin reductase-like flavin-dependent oxidoreductase (luciferase family) [Lapillicoccus jejuensis]